MNLFKWFKKFKALNALIYTFICMLLLPISNFSTGVNHPQHSFFELINRMLSKGIKISFYDRNSLLDDYDSFLFGHKIDLVYTWVNGSDENWIKDYRYFTTKENIRIQQNAFSIRFIEGNELRYSLRSVEKYAIHFIRYIFIIVANDKTQIPCWLNTSHPKIKIITHKMIFKDLVPPESIKNPNLIFNFNSYSIENCILNIPNLGHKFIYFNDDFFLGRKVELNDFFSRFDKPKIYVNSRNYDKVEKEYQKYSSQAENDYAGLKYHSDVTFTVSTFKRKFGKATNLEHLHVAYPSTKYILQETRNIFSETIIDTIKSPFRRVNDIVMQYLTFQYGINNNLIQPIPNNDTEVAFLYGNIISDTSKFVDIYQNKVKLFCINIDIPSQTETAQAFLNIMFPNKSSFELSFAYNPNIESSEVKFWLNILNNRSIDR